MGNPGIKKKKLCMPCAQGHNKELINSRAKLHIQMVQGVKSLLLTHPRAVSPKCLRGRCRGKQLQLRSPAHVKPDLSRQDQDVMPGRSGMRCVDVWGGPRLTSAGWAGRNDGEWSSVAPDHFWHGARHDFCCDQVGCGPGTQPRHVCLINHHLCVPVPCERWASREAASWVPHPWSCHSVWHDTCI